MSMQIRGAIFDMDGTLVDSLGVWKIVWEKFGERFLGNPDFYPDEETDKLCHILACTCSAHRSAVNNFLNGFFIEIAVHFSINKSGCHTVYSDTAGADLFG